MAGQPGRFGGPGVGSSPAPMAGQPGRFGGPANPPAAAGAGANAGPGDGDASAVDGSDRTGNTPISANPAAVDILTGTGAIGRFFGLKDESGIRLGGLWVGDASGVVAGGRHPGDWGLNSLTVFDLSFDTKKMGGWKGGLFGTQFLQFSGQPTNQLAGAFPGFDSLEVVPPLVRQELYQLWYRQSLWDDRLVFRIGKLVPTYDFNNVVRPVPVQDSAAAIPAVSGLIYTPIFVNPTMLGKIPGYYNSATGITTTLAPTKNSYLSYGVYDGNLARGRQTGLEGPHFNGYYFHIGEAGFSYRVGAEKKPGNFGIGLWGQTGMLKAFNNAMVHGANGMYFFGAQRLWFQRPGRDNSGVSGFYQFGANNSNTMHARQFFGGGFTGFGLVPGRPDDSMGCGLAWTWLNNDPNAARLFFPDSTAKTLPLSPSQLMMSAYYQMKLFPGCFFQPNLTYIPTPGMHQSIPSALAVTFRLVVLF
ncbi:carbohydrate porin [Singulisphaera sp. Ch08]|uniref:Carbohydrate porin n=1 Tax=Singulisphaera sp. Ch08 TaxID=3120278 RepID=A0AAU7CLG5_9BACT